tara:strand:- start:1471 stop:2562 length:1092 start_codon:yes stop_codon:yes gene_type:complete
MKFLDIYNQDKQIINKIKKDFKKNVINGDFILGKSVKDFEKKFASFCNSRFAIGCGNGTDALTIALKALNLPKNSEIIIPAMTYCSTAFAVINANLKPVLADIDYLKPTISIEKIKKKINLNTRVIIPVHLYGSSSNIKGIKRLVKYRKIKIIDDCAQAHGAYDDSYNGKRILGSTTDISCFSFYPGKNLGAYGDAGIITTNNKKYYNIINKIRNLGSDKKFIHDYVGMNSRLDTIQASILSRKLSRLNAINKKRRKIAKFYNEKINNKKISKLIYSKNCVYHQYVVLTKNRKSLAKLLSKNKIPYGFHYPYPINKLHALRKIFKGQKYPNAEKIGKEGISLPIDPNLSILSIKKIIKIINSF